MLKRFTKQSLIVSTIEARSTDLRRQLAATVVDSLVLGHLERRDDPGLGHDETSPLATLSRRGCEALAVDLSEDEQFENVAKAGQLMPGLELDIFDEEFNRLPHDGETVGEILIRGPWICSEYFNNPQPDKFHEGWLITGDVGKIDPEEYLIISDRSKDLVKSGGEWISSVDLENHIVALPGVAQLVWWRNRIRGGMSVQWPWWCWSQGKR